MPKQSQKNTRRLAPDSTKTTKQKSNLWPLIVALFAFVVGLYRAIDLRWISDDAFITMRYVKNFVEGNGLVYNVGERVEGYTHFLWLMLLSAFSAIGYDPVDASIWLGIVAYGGVLLILLVISYREYHQNSRGIWLPIATVLFAINYDTAEWASGGLETSIFMFLALGAYYIWFYAGFSLRRTLLLTGVTLALVSLTRPDGMLFTVTAVVLLASSGIKKKQHIPSVMKSIGLLLLPSAALGVPYLIWKYSYYGNMLPLTYYAKSAGGNYFGQGLYYIWFYFRLHITSAIALVASIILFLRKPWSEKERDTDFYRGSTFITALTAIAVYLIFFVARVGGDFMLARFIIPVVPFVYLIIEQTMERLPLKTSKQRIGIAVLLLAATLIEEKVPMTDFLRLGDDGKRLENWNLVVKGGSRFIADERWYYYDAFLDSTNQLSKMDIYSDAGKYLEPFFRGLPVTVAIPGAMNMVAYYANYANAINEYGLTDSFIARSPLSVRGHVGHEKKAPEEYLQTRHANFELMGLDAELPKTPSYTLIAFEIPELGVWQLARLITYDSSLFNELSRRFRAAGNKSILPLFDRIIPDYVEHVMTQMPLDQLVDDYSGFRQIYFDRYPDPILQHRFEERISELKRDSIAHASQ